MQHITRSFFKHLKNKIKKLLTCIINSDIMIFIEANRVFILINNKGEVHYGKTKS